MICAPAACNSSGETLFTVACVPTGINIGVWIVPARAHVPGHSASIAKEKNAVIYSCFSHSPGEILSVGDSFRFGDFILCVGLAASNEVTGSQSHTAVLLTSDLSRVHPNINERCLQDSTEKQVMQANHTHISAYALSIQKRCVM